MRTDSFGQPVDLDAPEAVTSWDATVKAFLAHGADTPVHLAATLSAAPEFALGHAVKGLFFALLGRSEMMDQARAALDSARAHAGGDLRTARFAEALEAYLDGRLVDAVRALEAVLDQSPTDTLAMKLSHAIRFVMGDRVGMLASVERVLPAYEPGHPGYGYLLGCRSFALEEAGRYAEAEAAGRAAVDLAPDDAWGLHAVTHVHDMSGDSRAGLAWLSGRESAWAHCNNFRFHVWWHKALLMLDQGETDAVMALYDAQIRSEKTDDYRDISNATSLLSRLELEGVDVGDRWAELADFAEARTEDGCLVFADLHYLLALVGDRREVATHKLMRRMHRDARNRSDDVAMRMARPGLSAGAGLEAFGAGDYRTAFFNLAAARKSLQLAGGSHAQRDVFERLTIDSGIRAGCLDAAEAILADRVARRAGREDRYAAARRQMIANGRSGDVAPDLRIPAE